MSSTEYRQRVFKLLENMDEGTLDIKQLVSPRNRVGFVQVVKEYIYENDEKEHVVELNHNSTKVIKWLNDCDNYFEDPNAIHTRKGKVE